MSAKHIMVQGTASHVGKSVVAAALCRYFVEEGYRVVPFKAQNMSNNSFVTASGEEISRAQAFQALACGIEPMVEMNPVLLKPAGSVGSQVVLLGKAVRHMTAREYHEFRPCAMQAIRESLQKLERSFEMIVMEGAGSPAEVNLRPFDIANMEIAKMASASVLLVGNIEWGGIFAALAGTLDLLPQDERALVKGLLINKFRGDSSLFDDGRKFLEERTGKRVLGVLPFLPDLAVAEEDSIAESKFKRPLAQSSAKLSIAVVALPHISNSTDFESLEAEPDVAVCYLTRVPAGEEPLPALLVLPGSKSTIADLAFLRSSGMASYIARCHQAGVPVFGICGGYQMLGRTLYDPYGVESSMAEMDGLGLLDVTTTFEPVKTTARVLAESLEDGEKIAGYEIHMGRTVRWGSTRPLLRIVERSRKPADDLEGALSGDGNVRGTYVHGVFDTPNFRQRILNELRRRRGWMSSNHSHETGVEETLKTLSRLVREHMDLGALMSLLD